VDVNWEYMPGLWVSEKGEAYVAHGTAVLKRSAAGHWKRIYEGSGVERLTAIWGTPRNELFVASLTSASMMQGEGLSKIDATIWRYDGKRWTKEHSDPQVSITAIWGAGDEVWATGADRSSLMKIPTAACSGGCPRGSLHPDVIDVSVHQGILLHRINGSWRRVELPKGLPMLSSVWASGTNNVYIGTLGRGLWHFDGESWERHQLRGPRPGNSVISVYEGDSFAEPRDLDFIHAIWGAPEKRILVRAGPFGPGMIGQVLVVLDETTRRTVEDLESPPSSMHGTADHVLGSLAFGGVAELRDGKWTTFHLGGGEVSGGWGDGEVSGVWAGKDYDYALCREGKFWFRKHEKRQD
jgi:hypothetical protein